MNNMLTWILIPITLVSGYIYVGNNWLLLARTWGLFNRNPGKSKKARIRVIEALIKQTLLLLGASILCLQAVYEVPPETSFIVSGGAVFLLCTFFYMAGDVLFRKRTPNWH